MQSSHNSKTAHGGSIHNSCYSFQKSISLLKAESLWALFTTAASFPCLSAQKSVANPLCPSAATQTAAAVGSSITETLVALQLSIRLPDSAVSSDTGAFIGGNMM